VEGNGFIAGQQEGSDRIWGRRATTPWGVRRTKDHKKKEVREVGGSARVCNGTINADVLCNRSSKHEDILCRGKRVLGGGEGEDEEGGEGRGQHHISAKTIGKSGKLLMEIKKKDIVRKSFSGLGKEL